MRHHGILLALGMVRAAYVSAAVLLLESHGWLNRHRAR